MPGRLFAQLWLAFVVDYSGNVGLIAVMKYVPALVVAAALLLGPLVASAEGIMLQVEEMPGPWTLAGGAIIVAGSVLIAVQAQRQSTTVDLGMEDLGGVEQVEARSPSRSLPKSPSVKSPESAKSPFHPFNPPGI
uniref:EamA domain-containing protein n=1 Tax=Haptolina brevifila TaxID=156173 RepID=A0A7S2J176_9EUKA|mmetsp:Transcript_74829/g.148709  ORF Transcript_74829/g.148709 Transcript_74829/m.148709 type:complete len:135 (+) Transcript_74829:30-434(+)